jgi:regulatory protein
MRTAPRRVDDPSDVEAAERAAVRILGGAAQSTHGLQQRLLRRGFAADAATAAVERCRELGYIDDSELAASVAARHARHGHGAARVAADLRRRGVSRAVIDATTAGIAGEEDDLVLNTARMLVEREQRRGDMNDQAWQRVGAALQRRGFSAGAVRRVLRGLDDGHRVQSTG